MSSLAEQLKPLRNVNIELGRMIRIYRLKKNMSQRELSVLLGHGTSQFVSMFERGVSKIPYNTLGQMVVFLDIPEKKVLSFIIQNLEKNITAQLVMGKKLALRTKRT